MTTTRLKAIPESYQRIMLINPSRDLTSLLIAGDLILKFQQHCQQKKIAFLLVIDDRFKDLIQGLIPESSLFFYPGEQMDAVGSIGRVRIYLSNVRRLKRFKADIAFTIEDDPLPLRLMRSSGAKFKLVYSEGKPDIAGIDHIISANKLSQLKPRQQHRWNAYYSMFSALGMTEPKCQYMTLAPKLLTTSMQDKLISLGIDFNFPIVVLHPGASNDSNKWPLLNFVTLSLALVDNGYQPVFIGKGLQDRSANNAIMNILDKQVDPGKAINLIDCFTLPELASFLILCTAMVANSSGPFHLASALGVPGCIIQTPGEVANWRPLFTGSHVMVGTEDCDTRCKAKKCLVEYRCLSSIKPDSILEKLSIVIDS